MKSRRSSVSGDHDTVNPYLALTDVLINLVFILLFFASAILFLGRLGQGDIQYKQSQDELKIALEQAFPLQRWGAEQRLRRAVWNNPGKNDPPGTQRWVLDAEALFKEGTSELQRAQAGRQGGAEIVLKFSEVLRSHRDTWRRIRIEGHTVPPPQGQPDDWDLSAKRATVIARLLSSAGRIESYYLSVSARAGQDPLIPPSRRSTANRKENERVEFVIEYSKANATASPIP